MFESYQQFFFFLLWRCDPTWVMAASFLRFSTSYTTTHHSRQDSSGRAISSSQRPLLDNTQHSHKTNIHATGGIRTHDLSRWAAVDLRLRPPGHWDRPYQQLHLLIIVTLSLSTPSRECQPTSVSEPSLWASFSAASTIKRKQLSDWCVPKTSKDGFVYRGSERR